MEVSVIIPTHNRADALEKTLQHLAKQDFSETWEVIVVNNNCTDKTKEVVQSVQANFPVSLYLINQSTPGPAATRNAGGARATGTYLVFADNDILTESDFVSRHYKALRQYPNSWIVGQVINLPEQENSEFGKYRKTLFPILQPTAPVEETDGITGQTVSLPREHFVKLNGFDEKFHVASGEDHEFAMRARKQLGVKTLLVPSIIVIHNDWAGWTFPDFCRRQEIYSRTEFYFWQKYGDEYPRQALIRENLPVNWKQDSLKTIARKKTKQIAGNSFSQSVLQTTCNLLEKSSIFRPWLWQLYKLTLAGAINRGFREGREKFSTE